MTDLSRRPQTFAQPAGAAAARPAAARHMARAFAWITGDRGLVARAMRSSAWTIFGYGVSQAVRLAANLILTRLLFPEAFGMMALVTVVMVGLQQFSDLGTGPAIMQNRRGDDPEFLDTAWTLQTIRGLCLWLGTCALAWPIARFYGEPQLAHTPPRRGPRPAGMRFLPDPDRDGATATSCSGASRCSTSRASWSGSPPWSPSPGSPRSIWALVVGGVAGALARLVLMHAFLPGHTNRFRWAPETAAELMRFGRWIFLSTVCGFVIAQGDRVILGKYLSLDLLGIYNIGYFLASFPLLLGAAVTGRILIPLYRESPPAASAENFRKLRLMRFGLTGAIVALLLVHGLLRHRGRRPALRPEVRGGRPGRGAHRLHAAAAGHRPDLRPGRARRRQFAPLLPSAGAAGRRAHRLPADRGRAGRPRRRAARPGPRDGARLSVGHLAGAALRAWDPLHDAAFAATALVFGGLALWLHRADIAVLAALGMR